MLRSIIARLEPYAFRLAQAGLAVAALYAAWLLAGPHVRPYLANPLSAEVVVFDVVRLANAQRMVASAFIKPETASPDAATSLMAMQKQTREVIRRIAGPGTVVLVKQAVVSDHLPDITDAVLKELGLPLNAPTQNVSQYLLDEAPTNLTLIPQIERKPAPRPLPDNSPVVP